MGVVCLWSGPGMGVEDGVSVEDDEISRVCA